MYNILQSVTFLEIIQTSKNMITRLITTAMLSVSLLSCNGQAKNTIDYAVAEPLPIHRFDNDLLQLLESADTIDQVRLKNQYNQMLDVFGKAVLNLKSVETIGFFGKLRQYFSEPTLRGLYHDATKRFASVGKIEKDLGYGFAYLKQQIPSIQVPAIYMHVSGLNQNILVSDSLLSLSIDKYLGNDYPLYQDFFYDFQKRKMNSELIVPDYLSGWLMSEFPFEGKQNVLLDRMIYEGKIKYVLTQSLHEVDEATLMGYTEKELQCCKDHEGEIWKKIIASKHLYTPDLQTTSKYLESAPLLFNEIGAPGSLGIWLGWQIVEKYMKESGSTIENLMRNADCQSILTISKYKP